MFTGFYSAFDQFKKMSVPKKTESARLRRALIYKSEFKFIIRESGNQILLISATPD